MLIKIILNDFAFKNAKRLAGNSLFHSVIVSYCYFSVYSLVFVLIEKIYQTLETVFHRSVWVERESLPDCHRLLLQMVWNQGTPQWNIPNCYSSTQGTLRHPRHSRSNNVWQWAPVQRRFLSRVCHQIWLCTHHKFTKIPANEWRSWVSSPYS